MLHLITASSARRSAAVLSGFTGVIAALAIALAPAAAARTQPGTIRGTDCHLSASGDQTPSGSLSCAKRYTVSLSVCVQVRGAHGRWFNIKGDCHSTSGRTPGGIGVTIAGFTEHCNRSYRTRASGTADGKHGTVYVNFGCTVVG